MEITDIILLAIIIVFGVRGLMKGFVHEVIGVVALIAGYALAYKFSLQVGLLFKSFELSEKAMSALGFVIVFILVYIVCMVIATFLSKALKSVSLTGLNRGGGFVFGAIKSAVILSVILSSLVSFLPRNSSFSKQMEKGATSGFLLKLTPVIYDLVNKIPGENKINPFRDREINLDPVDMFKKDPGEKMLEKVKDKTFDIRDSAVETTDDMMKKIENMTTEEKDKLVEKLLEPKPLGSEPKQ
jgi:membrane protein required for colicin V production